MLIVSRYKLIGIGLREVESNIRNLRNYVQKFETSKNAVDEFEILPETITSCFTGFHNDVCALMRILPQKPSPSLAKKIKWVFNQRKVKDVTTRLNERKLSLNNALSITGR